jgi:hypothetical protein
LTDKQLTSLLDAYAADRLAALPAPESAPRHDFSAAHREAMAPLMRQASRPLRSVSRAVRAALVAAALIAMTTLSVFSVDAPVFRQLRSGLVTIYQQVTPLYTEQHFEVDDIDDGECPMKTVSFGYLPEGIAVKDKLRISENTNHEHITFEPSILHIDINRLTDNGSMANQIDSENTLFSEVDINGTTAILGVKKSRVTLQWTIDNYLLLITSYDLDEATVCKIAENIVLQ